MLVLGSGAATQFMFQTLSDTQLLTTMGQLLPRKATRRKPRKSNLITAMLQLPGCDGGEHLQKSCVALFGIHCEESSVRCDAL